MISEKEILDKFQINKESGLFHLHNKYADICYAVAFRYLQNQEDAEERVIDTFLSAFNNLSKFKYEREGLLKNWLKKICINHCLQCIRQRSKIVFSDLDEVNIVSLGSPSDILQYDDLIALLLKLPDAQRFVFQLYEVDGFSHQEISEKLGISIGTSKSYLHRAKTALKVFISQDNYCHE